MRRYIGLFQFIVIVWMTLVSHVLPALANGLFLPFYQQGVALAWEWSPVGALAAIFCATVMIEYLVMYALLGWPPRARAELLLWVLFINAVTNPASQVAAFFLGDERLTGSEGLAWTMICGVELVAAVVELFLMRWAFGQMYRRGVIDQDITGRRAMVIVFTANLASFAFGFIVLLVLMEVVDLRF